jgi:AraC family transcriptional activator of pyochelin receptor
MALEIQDISQINSQRLDSFFLTGNKHPTLIEHVQQIQLPFADVLSKEWYFDGIRMGYSDWRLSKPVDLRWRYAMGVDLVTLQVNLNGSLIMEDEGSRANFLLEDHQHNLFYSQAGTPSSGVLKNTKGRITLLMIQFTKDHFLALTQDANQTLNGFNENILQGKPAMLSPGNLPLEAAFKNVIANIVHCGYTAGIKKMYLLSKTIELLVMQAEASNAASQPAYHYLKSAYDKECIGYVQQYLMKNVASLPTLSQLAKIAGINEYKLKRGFKEMFNNTVFGYLAEARLELAKNDLLQTNKKVNEIASELGYSSVQHFSSAFKKKFGFSPNRVRR